MSDKNKTEELIDGLKKYLDTNTELLKLEVAQQSTAIGSIVFSGIIISLILGFFVLFLSLWAGFYISTLLDAKYVGFLIVAGFYLLLFLIVFFGRKQLLETPTRNLMIKKLFSK